MSEGARVLGIVVLALAVPGLWFARGTPWLARLCGFAVAAVAFVAALDPRSVREETLPAHVVVVPTAAPGATVDALTQRLRKRGVRVDLASSGPRLRDRLTEAALLAGASGRIALLWNGSFAPDSARASIAAQRAVALTERAELPFDWKRFAVEVVSRSERDRPLQLVANLPGVAALGTAALGRLTVTAPGGAVLVAREFTGAELSTSTGLAVTLTPKLAGDHAVDLELRLASDATTITAHGVVRVAEPDPVAVIGVGGDDLAAALRAQGRTVRRHAKLPEPLSDVAAVVLLDPLSEAEQRRVLELVEAGTGVLLVGAQGGGALARPGEPLARFQPVRRTEPADDAKDPGPASGPGAGHGNEPSDPERREPPPKRDEPPPPPPPAPERNPERPPSGDTSGAQLRRPEPVEVERRSVALVLLVDVSGSMSEPASVGDGRAKIEYAKASAFATASALLPGDELGVVSFGEYATNVLPLSQVADVARFENRIAGLRANQQDTQVRAALELALRQLMRTECAVRHVVIVTDGAFHDMTLARRSLQQLRAAGVTTSLVQILGGGSQDDPVEAEAFARAGGGTYATPLSGSEVPRIVSAEVRAQLAKVGRRPRGEAAPDAGSGGEAASRPASAPPAPPDPKPPQPKPPEPKPASRPASLPESAPRAWPVRALVASQLLLPEPAAGFPALTGLVPAVAAPDAYTLLVAGSEGLPLLAFANHGLGKVGAFCSDLTGSWTAEFRREAGHPGRLSQWIAFLDRPREANEAPATLELETTVTPPTPSADEAACLAALAGAPLAPITAFSAPAPVVVERETGNARELALAVLGAVLVLALVEFAIAAWAARRAPRAKVSIRPSSPTPS